jgi:hypothetical protein
MFPLALFVLGCSGGGGAPDLGPLPLDCDAYCAQVIAACRGGNQQFGGAANCAGACGAFATGALTDRSGATLGCRLYHARAAATDPVAQCPSAGPGGAGVCGFDCEGYCAIAAHVCQGAAAIYASDDACQADCASRADTVRYDVSVASGPSVACLLEHAQAAAADPALCATIGDGGACR